MIEQDVASTGTHLPIIEDLQDGEATAARIMTMASSRVRALTRVLPFLCNATPEASHGRYLVARATDELCSAAERVGDAAFYNVGADTCMVRAESLRNGNLGSGPR